MMSKTSFSEARISFSLRDQGEDFLEFGDDLLALEARQPLQAHVEDRLRLDVVQTQDVLVFGLGRRIGKRHADELLEAHPRHRDLRHEAVFGLLGVLGGADDLDDLVNRGEGQREPAQEMRPLLGLLQVELRAPDDDRLAVVDEVPQQILERQDARLVVDDREEDDAEGRLHRRQRVELVQDDLGVLAALQLHHHPDAVAVRLVAQVGDAFDLLLVDELGDALDQLGLVDLVGDLRDDDRFLVAPRGFLDGSFGPHLDDAPTGLVGVPNALGAVDEGGGGEVGPREFLHELAERGVGMLDQLDGRIHDLGEVVRRDVGCHAHGNTGRAVDEEIGKLRRQDHGLDQGPVVVGRPVDGLLVDVVAQHLGRELG